MLIGAGLVFALHTLTGARLGHLTALFGAASLGIFYWFNVPTVINTVAELIDEPVGDVGGLGGARLFVGALILAWLVRGLRHAGELHAASSARRAAGDARSSRSAAPSPRRAPLAVAAPPPAASRCRWPATAAADARARRRRPPRARRRGRARRADPRPPRARPPDAPARP